jgi:hypothetical protein
LDLSKSDLREIQLSDKAFYKLISDMELANINEFKTFVLYEEILYKTKEIMGQTVFRLCLPNYLGKDILQKLHFKNEVHLTPDNLLKIFNQNFYTVGCGKIVSRI